LENPLAREAITRFVDEVVNQIPVHRSFIERAARELTNGDANDLADYLHYASQTLSLDQIADAYSTIVVDTQMAQIEFMRSGRYRHSTFAEVSDDVYFDDDYMRSYMHGLAISSFLWPNHNLMHHYFLSKIPRSPGGSYLEIGPGHGYYFMKAARLGDFDRLVGVDISPTSIALTKSVLEYYGVFEEFDDRIELSVADFLTSDIAPADCSMIVMGEVLEHVEEPALFLERLCSIAGRSTTVYVTTCVNAPAIDHIYLYRTTDEVDRMILNAGFSIDDHLFIPYAGQTLETCQEKQLAINVCYVLSTA
jgi:2-polyprenyl-3-methyl-5-hydroxy-6-metoxy-1,4-benzoquinol methylase